MENISEAVIKRLPIYYRNICFMEAEGFEKITSLLLKQYAPLKAIYASNLILSKLGIATGGLPVAIIILIPFFCNTL